MRFGNRRKLLLREEAASRASRFCSGDHVVNNDKDYQVDSHSPNTQVFFPSAPGLQNRQPPPPPPSSPPHPLSSASSSTILVTPSPTAIIDSDRNDLEQRQNCELSSIVSVSSSLAESARQEWRRHHSAISQALEEKRMCSAVVNTLHTLVVTGRRDLIVRVISAETRKDPSGSTYTAYIIRVLVSGGGGDCDESVNRREMLTEHRYSDFCKLHAVLRKNGVLLDTTFPSKNLAGRIGNWTPSFSLAPEFYDDLVQYRIIQLDLWLVHLLRRYNAGVLPQPVMEAVYDFLMVTQRPPCEQENDVEDEAPWKWNNPLAFTLGSSIRQATSTIQYMVKSTCTIWGQPDHSIPLDLLQAAKGLCFMTVFKAGLVVSGRVGTGLVIAKSNSSNDSKVISEWSAPCAVGTVGMGWGALVGGDVTHYLIVLTTDQAVQDLVASSSVQLGAELGVAVGPLGRGATSHLQTGDWTLHPAYAYAHSQGLFFGMSLEGSVIKVRHDVNAKFYGQACHPHDILRQPGPKAAEPLYLTLQQAMKVHIPEGSFRPSQLFSPTSKQKSSSLYGAPFNYTRTSTESTIFDFNSVFYPSANSVAEPASTIDVPVPTTTASPDLFSAFTMRRQ